MANLLYRQSSSAPLPVATAVKGDPLTYLEADGNFRSLNDDIQTRAKLTDATQIITASAFYGNGANLTNVVSETANTANLATNAVSSNSVKTVNSSTNAPHYLTFVDSANSSAASEVVYTDSGISFNPSTDSLTVGGTVTATDFNSTSDARLKENILPVEGIELIFKMFPVKFNFVDSGKQSYGVIAQELEKNFPELVSEREDGYKTVSYIPIIAILLDAVQNLSERVKQLEGKQA